MNFVRKECREFAEIVPALPVIWQLSVESVSNRGDDLPSQTRAETKP
jgi:hypothetical protein